MNRCAELPSTRTCFSEGWEITWGTCCAASRGRRGLTRTPTRTLAASAMMKDSPPTYICTHTVAETASEPLSPYRPRQPPAMRPYSVPLTVPTMPSLRRTSSVDGPTTRHEIPNGICSRGCKNGRAMLLHLYENGKYDILFS